MHREGHVGAALLAYAPLGAAVALLGVTDLAVVGGAACVALTMVPDYDVRVPLVRHRGVTHTPVFAVTVGGVVGVVGGALGGPAGPSVALVLGSFGFAVGTLSILAHVAADALTPAGVEPLWPVSGRRYSLDLVRARDPLANYALLLVGLAVSGGGYLLAVRAVRLVRLVRCLVRLVHSVHAW